MGYATLGHRLFFSPSLITIVFFAILCVTIYSSHREIHLRVMGGLPLLISSLFFCNHLIYAWMDKNSPVYLANPFNKFLSRYNHFGSGFQLRNLYTWYPDLLILLLIICIFTCVWHLFEKKETALVSFVILLMGMASKFILAFSPTIWASDLRVDLVLYICLIAVTQMILHEQEERIVNLSLQSVILAAIANFFIF